MKKLIPFLFAFLFVVQAQAYSPVTAISKGGTGATTAAQARTNLGITNSGSGVAIIYNDPTAAAANTSAIQTALSAGGFVGISCPPATPVFYTNASVAIGSHTNLKLSNCAWTLAANSNAPVIVNSAYTKPWAYINQGVSNITWNATLPSGQNGNGLAATLYWPNHGLSVGSWVQLGPMSDNPAWATGTYYDVGVHVLNGGNSYTVTTAGTSAASGTGPSGSGSSISDGTVVWSYTAANGSSPSYFWSGTAAATAQGGLIDTAYAGVFYVASVTDANNVVIVLRRRPSAAYTGAPIMVRAADHDIEVDGGNSTVNCNGANQTSTLTSQKVCVLQVGVARAYYHNFSIQNTRKWAFGVEGAANIDLEYVDGSPEQSYIGANQNQFMDYGCFDCTVGYVRGWGYDDSVAIQSSNAEQAQHYDELFMPGQDVIGFHAHHVRTEGGLAALSVWNLHNSFYMDGITLDHAAAHSNQAVIASVRFQFATSAVTATGGTASNIGSIRVSDSEWRDAQPFFAVNGTYGTVNVGNLTFDHMTGGQNINGSEFVAIDPPSGTTLNVRQLNITDSYFPVTSSWNLLYLGQSSTGTLNLGNLNLERNELYYASGSAGVVLHTGSSDTMSIGQVNIKGNQITNVSYLYLGNYPTIFNIKDNTLTNVQHGIQSSVAGITANYCGDTLSGGSVALYFSAAVSATLNSCGDNTLSSSTWVTYGSAGTPTLHGWDIACDVTKASRTTGEYCLNTNTAPGSGTLTTAGPVMDQGTAALSWFLMSNPTGQQY